MKDKQDAVEVAEDKKKSLKVMKMCIFLYIFTLSFSIISICLTSDESFLPVPSQYFHPQVPPYWLLAP